MGTSGSSGGPNPSTPLVPSWLQDVGDTDEDVGPEEGGDRRPLPPLPPAPPPDRFRAARRNFSAFARSGGKNRPALRRAVRDYVRSGAGGGSNATARMGSSRSAARGLLSVFRDFQRDGVESTLKRLNLGDLIGRSLEEIFLGLSDVVCADGGSIDEGIAREAWLETVVDLGELQDTDATTLTPERMRDLLLAFVSNSVIGRLLQDIGASGFKIAADLATIEAFDSQLKSYIRRSVSDSFSGNLNPATLTDRDVREAVDRIYGDAWDLLVLQGDRES